MCLRDSNPPPPCPPPRFEALESRRLCAVDLAGSLVAHWTFEDANAAPAQFADASPDGQNSPATRVGDAQLVTQNRYNRVLILDGVGDRLAVANANDINLGIHGQRTIAFWFRVDDAQLNTRKQVIYEEGGSSRGLNLYVFDGRVYVGGWNIPGGAESGWAGTWLSTEGVVSGKWQHLALTLDGGPTTSAGAFRGYLDGQRFAQGDGSQLWPHGGSITVGDHSDSTVFHDATGNGGGTAGFAGQLDDGRVYNRALDASEIFTLARGPAASQSTPHAQTLQLTAPGFTGVLAPPRRVDLAAPRPAPQLNAKQTPDYPSRAFPPPTAAEASSSDRDAPPPSAWEDLWEPQQLWDQLTAIWTVTPQDSATAEVNVDVGADMQHPPLQ